LHPEAGHFGPQILIEGGVDLEDIEEPGEVVEGMKVARFRGRVDDAIPVRVMPSGKTAAEAEEVGGGGRRHRRPLRFLFATRITEILFFVKRLPKSEK
jgi:hypothetical protein